MDNEWKIQSSLEFAGLSADILTQIGKLSPVVRKDTWKILDNISENVVKLSKLELAARRAPASRYRETSESEAVKRQLDTVNSALEILHQLIFISMLTSKHDDQ